MKTELNSKQGIKMFSSLKVCLLLVLSSASVFLLASFTLAQKPQETRPPTTRSRAARLADVTKVDVVVDSPPYGLDVDYDKISEELMETGITASEIEQKAKGVLLYNESPLKVDKNSPYKLSIRVKSSTPQGNLKANTLLAILVNVRLVVRDNKAGDLVLWEDTGLFQSRYKNARSEVIKNCRDVNKTFRCRTYEITFGV